MVAVEVHDIEGSGRGLVAVTPIAAGELVLRESPVLLTVTQELHKVVCAHCLRYVRGTWCAAGPLCISSNDRCTPCEALAESAGQPLDCKGCSQASFCNQSCQQTAARRGHAEAVCSSMAEAGLQHLQPEVADQARFIIQAQALIDPDVKGGALWKKKALAQLQSSDEAHPDTSEVLKWAESYFGPELWPKWKGAATTLVSQDRINSYGIMAPVGPDGERRIRGSGVYHMSSLLNHDCMPNVARYDDFDSTIEENTVVEFRALHDIPADTQITQSYFPLSWSYEERQQRCQEQYGFTCQCDRCQVEQQYSDDDEEGEQADAAAESDPVASGSATDAEHDKRGPSDHITDQSNAHVPLQKPDMSHEEGTPGMQDEDASGNVEEDDDDAVDEAYVMAYLGRHCCSQLIGTKEDSEAAICGGTMTPVGIHGDLYACNMCGHERLESERIAELEKMYSNVAVVQEEQ